MMKRLLTVMSFATLSLALPAWADETALPPVQHAGQATYISGGIGNTHCILNWRVCVREARSIWPT